MAETTLTNEECIEKYPIDTKIKFLAKSYMSFTAQQDNGKVGKVVGHWQGLIRIYLPESDNYWLTTHYTIKKLKVKGQQLLFAFMEQEDG